MLVIEAAVTNVEDLSSLQEYLSSLGRKHRAVGVRLGSFSVGSGVLSHSRASAKPAAPALSQSCPTAPYLTAERKKGLLYLCARYVTGTDLTSLSLGVLFNMASLRTVKAAG